MKRVITLIRRIREALAAAVGGWATRLPMRAMPRLPELKPAVWKAVTRLPSLSKAGIRSSPE